tara:strand:- start:1183 stop:1824 length:642 start_codon:yes stop_codon:yes gene_type:complete
VAVNKNTSFVSVPTPIGLILLSLVQDFNSKRCRIPHFIKEADQSLKIEFLRKFFDDEAYARYAPPHRYIELTLSNKEFLEDITSLLLELEITPSRIYYKNLRGFDTYYFYIKGHEELRKFHKIIGFNHPDKKETLIKIVKNPGRFSYKSGETKERILKLLKEKHYLSVEIAKSLKRRLCTINHFLKILEKEGKIKCIGKKGKFRLYEVKTNVI